MILSKMCFACRSCMRRFQEVAAEDYFAVAGLLCVLCGVFASFAVKSFGLCKASQKSLTAKVAKKSRKGH